MVIEEVVTNVLETKFKDFTQENIEDAKYRMIDVVGCAIGGAYASGNSILIDLVREWGGKKEATILVHGDRVPARYAAMVNSTMCRSYDYEVCGPRLTGPLVDEEVATRPAGHILGTTDCTAFTIADQKAASGKELLAAAILGGDLSARMLNTEDSSSERSFDKTGTVNAFGATAIVGRLWGLNKHQMLNAFGIAVLEIAGGTPGAWDGVHTFKLQLGLSAKHAVFSAELASKGFTGIKDPLFGPGGYFPQYCRSYRPEFLTHDLGKVFYTKGEHKIHPSCYGNHQTIDCGLKILGQHDIHAEDIAEVTLGVRQHTIDDWLGQPFEMGDSPMKALFRLPYAIANVLLRKSVRLEHYTDEFIRDPRVIELARKVKLVPIWADKRCSIDVKVEVKVKMKDGREFSAQSDPPRGRIDNPLTREQIKDKYWTNVDFSRTVPRESAEKALNMLENLERIDNVSKIVKLLVG